MVQDPLHGKAQAVYAALTELVETLVRRTPGAASARPPALELRQSLALKDPGDAAGKFAQALLAGLQGQLDDAVRAEASFRPGRVWCHHCAGSECAHAAPPSAQHVFAGYAPTGLPEWMPLSQLALELRHPDVDRLYGDRPAFVTLLHDGTALKAGLLEAWKDASSDSLGQLAAGYFLLPHSGPAGREHLALTFQVSGGPGHRGRLHLGLNVLGCTPQGDNPAAAWPHDRAPWSAPVTWARDALAAVAAEGGPGQKRDRKRLEARVAGILGGLGRRLERAVRGRARRTTHAETRHRAGDRPTRTALSDVRATDPRGWLLDTRKDTLVIPGARGRTHFFTRAGKLVSSVRYSRDAIARKRKQGHWREATPEETGPLQQALQEKGEPGLTA